MLVLIFDLEEVFADPRTVALREFGWAGLWQMAVFLGIFGVTPVRGYRPLSRSAGIGQLAASLGAARDTPPRRFSASMWLAEELQVRLRSVS